MADILITGATGYMGRALARLLLARGHRVTGLVRRESAHKLPGGVEALQGNALDEDDVRVALAGCDAVVHLVGTPHPAPWKQREFEAIDAVSLRATASAAKSQLTPHVVYVSVAHPAPAMRGYIAVRVGCEQELARLHLRRTILRPWYVLGPGHRWPVLLKPLYALAEAVPATRERALRLGLVTHAQMVGALAWAVEHPPQDVQTIDVPGIRELGDAVIAGAAAPVAEAAAGVAPSASSRRV